jgi:hypothetical protein
MCAAHTSQCQQNWREYEHLHTLLWLSKDLSWNQGSPIPWVIFMVPTLLIAVDFIWMTWSTKVSCIDALRVWHPSGLTEYLISC